MKLKLPESRREREEKLVFLSGITFWIKLGTRMERVKKAEGDRVLTIMLRESYKGEKNSCLRSYEDECLITHYG